MLSPNEQWTLHGYYEFTKSLGDEKLLAHRVAVTRAQPPLPQRAGKAIAHLALFSERLETYRASPHPETRKKGAPHKVRVFGQVNPDTDPDVMAKILIDVGKEIQSRSRP